MNVPTKGWGNTSNIYVRRKSYVAGMPGFRVFAGNRNHLYFTDERREAFIAAHPTKGETTYDLFESIMTYLSSRRPRNFIAMARDITRLGLPEPLEEKLRECENEAAIRTQPKPNGELFLLKQLLDSAHPHIYKAIDERYHPVWFTTP